MSERSDIQKHIPASLESAASTVDADDWNISVKGILHGIWHRRNLVIAFTVAGVLFGVIFAILPRHYRSTSKLQVRPGSANQYRVDREDVLGMGDTSTKLESETQVLQSDTLLLDMAETLHLDKNVDFMGSKLVGRSLSDPEARDHLLRKLHEVVTVLHLPRTEVINVSAESHSPQLSADMVNVLVEKYIDHLFQSRFVSTKRVADWLSGQLHSLKEKVEQDQEQLVQLQNQLGIVGLDQSHDIAVTELEDLTKSADEARMARIVAEARYRVLNSGDINLLEGGHDILSQSMGENSQLSLLSNLRNQRAQAESKYAALLAQYGARYPDVVQAHAELETLNREVSEEEKRVLNQARLALEAAQQNEQTTTKSLDQAKDLAYRKHGDMVKYQILLHDFESSRALYEGLLQRLEQAGIVSGLESSEVDVFDVARPASTPTEINRAIAIFIGGTLGLAIGLILAVSLGQFDNRLHNISEIESEINLSLLSVTPKIPKFARADIFRLESGNDRVQNARGIPPLFTSQAHSSFVESMWSLRTALSLSSGRPPKKILLTSCNPGDGKSTFSRGLASAFALRNSRVLLVEGDMRSPTLASQFEMSNSVGLSSVLTGAATVDQAIRPVPDLPALSLLCAGPLPTTPVALLGSESMTNLMESLEQQFDVIIIDSPPALGLADATLLAQYADVVVLVVNYMNLNKAKVRRIKNNMARVGKPMSGIALNFSPPNTLDYYGCGYSYYSKLEREAAHV